MAKNSDSKDPKAGAQPTRQKGDGNTSVTGEKHGQGKAEKVSAASRLSRGVGPSQPTRQGGGNTSVTGESHDQAKAEKISESARW